MSQLRQDITRKGRMNKFAKVPEFEFEASNDKEYKVEAIQNSAVYIEEIDRHLPRLYYLVTWKGYLEEENTWKPFSTVIHLWKIVNTFHKN